jgi:hypothetical protein
VRSDLDRLRKKFLPELSETLWFCGHRYRAFVDHAALGRGLARVAEALHYANFKGEVARSQSTRRAAAYSNAWTALWELLKEDDEEEKERSAAKARAVRRVSKTARG